MADSKPKCPICSREMEVVVERRASLVCLCPEHGRFYLCRFCGYATRSRRGIAGHVKLHRRVEITGGNIEAPQGAASKSLEISRNRSKPVEIPSNPSKNLEIPRNSPKSAETPSNPSKSLENSRKTPKPPETSGNSSKPLEAPGNSSKQAPRRSEPGGLDASGPLDPEQLADRLLEGKVSVQELSVLTERQLLLLIAALIVRLSRQPRGRTAKPTQEQAQAELRERQPLAGRAEGEEA